MSRSRLLRAVLPSLLLVAVAARTEAASTLVGATSCDLQGRMDFRPYLPLTATAKRVRVKAKTDTLVCDGSAVSGGRAPLGAARVLFNGLLPAGTDCASFLGTVVFEKSKLTVKWRGVSQGRLLPIGVSTAAVASASYDQGSFVIVTQPIADGSFAGSTMTMRLQLGDVSEFTEYCNATTGAVGFAAFVFGPPLNSNTWTISVP